MIPATILILIFCLSVVCLRVSNRTRRIKSKRSGKVLPHFDADTRFSRFKNGRELSESLRAQYGPLYTVKDGNGAELVLTTALFTKDNRRYVLHANNQPNEKPQNLGFGDYFGRLLGRCVGLVHGQRWFALRKAFETHFSHQIVKCTQDVVESQVAEWSASIEEMYKGDSQHSSSIRCEALEVTKLVPFKIVSMICFGEILSEKSYMDELLSFIELHDEVFSNATFNTFARHRIYRLLPWTRANDTLRTYQTRWRAFCSRVVDSSRANGYSSPVLEAYSSVEDNLITEIEWLQTIDEIIFANIDVTSSVIAWNLLWVGSNPMFCKALREEIYSQYAIQDDRNDLEVREAIFHDYIGSSETLLNASYLETLRISPPAFFSLPELMPRELTIGEWRIPKGFPFIVDAWALNHSVSEWGDDADEFNPWRFQGLKPGASRCKSS